MCAQKQAVKPA